MRCVSYNCEVASEHVYFHLHTLDGLQTSSRFNQEKRES